MKPDAMPGWQKDEPMTPNNDAEKALEDIATAFKSLSVHVQAAHIGNFKTIRTALAKSAKVDGLLEAMKMVMDELKEINLSNYNHDDVCSLNSSSVAGYLLLEEAIQRFNGEV